MNLWIRATGSVLVLAMMIAVPLAGGSDAGSAEKRAKHRTSVKLSSKFPAFSGRVSSGFEPCARHRRVELYRKVTGNDPKRLGSDRTSSSGRWAVRVDNVKSGAYYALAKPARAGKGPKRSVCRSGRSPVVVID